MVYVVTVQEKAGLQTKLANLSKSQSSTSSEVETLKRQADDTEREKRDLVGVICRLKEEGAQREGNDDSWIIVTALTLA